MVALHDRLTLGDMSSELIGNLHLQSHSSSLWCADQIPEAGTLKQQAEATAVPNTYTVKLMVSVVELMTNQLFVSAEVS